MQFSIIALLSLATMAIATPTAGKYVQTRSVKPLGLRSVSDAAQTCGDNKVLSCCNQANNVDANRGILSGNLDNLADLNCVAVQIPVLSTGDTTANDVCGAKSTVKCCDGNVQKGEINAGADCNDF